jgi:hypothetical protein
MKQFRTLATTLVILLISLTAVNCMAQDKEQQKESSPFLITGKMPHLTKVLMQQWDNAELHLTDEQKQKLLVVRKETIGSVQKLSKEISPLENQVVQGTLSGKTVDELRPLVQSIAKLKAEATMVHLRCLYNTNVILEPKQLEFITTM